MPCKHLQACVVFDALGQKFSSTQQSTQTWVKNSRSGANRRLCHRRHHAPPPFDCRGAVLVPVGTDRRHCNTVPRKIFGSSGGSILPTGETPGTGPPYSTVADPELLNSVLLVLSCGPDWGGAASDRRFASRLTSDCCSRGRPSRSEALALRLADRLPTKGGAFEGSPART